MLRIMTATLLLLSAFASPVSAERVIAIENVTQNLIEVDPATGATTTLGASGIPDTVFDASEYIA